MNFVETTVPRKTHGGRYVFAEYPKTVYAVDGRTKTVKSSEEEDAAFDDGFSETPPLLSPVLPQATLSTASGIQSSYDLLKKQFEETVREFNVRYADLEKKFKRANDNNDLLKMSCQQLEEDLAKAKAQLKAAYTSTREAAPVQDPQG